MKDYNISGFGFSIICKSKREGEFIHKKVKEYHEKNPEWVADKDNEMLAMACTYIAVAKNYNFSVLFHSTETHRQEDGFKKWQK